MGTVVLIGGALQADNRAVFASILEHCGPRIGIFTTASSHPAQSWEGNAAMFRAQGFDPQHIGITLENAASLAHDPAVLRQMESCSGFFFAGGDQRRITQALQGTPVLALLRRRFTEGAGVAGSSAGTAVMADPMIAGGSSLDTWLGEGDTLSLQPGLGLVRKVQVDQHFLAWGRFGRLMRAMEQVGVELGVGVDENTALVVPERGPWEVVGASHVAFLERTPALWQVSLLAQGDCYDPALGEFLIHLGRSPMTEPDPELKNLVSTDVFGPRILPWLLTRLVQSPDPAALGLSFRAGLEDSFSARGVRVRFFKSPETRGYDGPSAPGARYSVVRVGLALEAIQVHVEPGA
ncbi:MAG: cyanophycinase [Meiothermus sp.]|uniref:cyanophycinase n=1 Tax=Meiothermus sp. TaxID=1955249 RepID=UPI00298EF3C0|nr:cyanophycinase [Meiothermus sp.]MDW8426320.1 cyanophycinase [Meiothermus sp.]